MSDYNDGKPFYKQYHHCGRCGESVEVQEAMYHWMDKHQTELVLKGHYTDDRCSVCGDVVPGDVDIKTTLQHLFHEHDIMVVDAREVGE